jgi:YfiH family protein
MMEIKTINNIRFIILVEGERDGWLAVFGTRDLGASAPVAHARIKAAFPAVREIVTVHQVHGRRAVRVFNCKDALALRQNRAEADIIIVNAPGLAGTVRTADCAPILIYDMSRRVGAAVHAGWRGTAARAPVAAVDILVREYGSRRRDLRAAIGPCIGPCHYQVDEPVIEAISSALDGHHQDVLLPDGPGHARLDLSRVNRLILESAGVRSDRILETRLCTFCHDDLFYSYRRQGRGVPSLYHFIVLK